MRVPFIALTILWILLGRVPVAEAQGCDGIHPHGASIAHHQGTSQGNSFDLFHDALMVTPEIPDETDTEEESELKEENKGSRLDQHFADTFLLGLIYLEPAKPLASRDISGTAFSTPLFILYHSWKSFLP
jgi:hypothetical protein